MIKQFSSFQRSLRWWKYQGLHLEKVYSKTLGPMPILKLKNININTNLDYFPLKYLLLDLSFQSQSFVSLLGINILFQSVNAFNDWVGKYKWCYSMKYSTGDGSQARTICNCLPICKAVCQPISRYVSQSVDLWWVQSLHLSTLVPTTPIWAATKNCCSCSK